MRNEQRSHPLGDRIRHHVARHDQRPTRLHAARRYGGWDAKKAFEAISKQVFFARDPLTAVHATQLAIKHALAGEPGPVALIYRRSAVVSPAPPPADPDRVAAAAAAIRAADKPILWAGNGVRIGQAEATLARFA